MRHEPRAIDQRLSEASEWLLRLESAGRTEADDQAWLRWCDEDAGNFAAFEAVQRQWQNLDSLKGSVEPVHERAPSPATVRPRRTKLAWAIAAS